MKISRDKTTGRYIVSEKGQILYTVVDLGDAMRLAGLEPAPEDYPTKGVTHDR